MAKYKTFVDSTRPACAQSAQGAIPIFSASKTADLTTTLI